MTVKTFVLRAGRITKAQKRGMARLLPEYGVACAESPPDWSAIFARAAPLMLEIGCGRGEATIAFADDNPAVNCVAVDVYAPGLGALLNAAAAGGLRNIRVVRGDATLILRQMFADGALGAVHLFFPDPWPKKRHRKRRLINAAFVGEILAPKVAPGGVVRLATDDSDYAIQIGDAMNADGLFAAVAADSFVLPQTKFAARAEAAGRAVAEFRFQRSQRAACGA